MKRITGQQSIAAEYKHQVYKEKKALLKKKQEIKSAITAAKCRKKHKQHFSKH